MHTASEPMTKFPSVHGMALLHDEALRLAYRAELDEKPPPTMPHETTTRTKKEEA